MYSSSDSEDDWHLDDHDPARRRQRLFKPRINFMDPIIYKNRERFRLTNEHIDAVVALVGPFLKHKTSRNYALTPDQQVRICLRYLASGSNFQLIADSHGITKPSVSRAVHRVVEVINEHVVGKVICFPSRDEIHHVADRFRQIAGLSACIGAVDGTHITIRAPNVDPCQFINRKGRHSINTMIVADPDLRVLFCSPNMPGCSHDSRVFRRSDLPNLISPQQIPLPNGYLVGDSGYPNLENLITPLSQASITTDQQAAFQRAHIRTRQVVERTIGVVKARFGCIGCDNNLPFKPQFAAKVIRAVFAVHDVILSPDLLLGGDAVVEDDVPVDPNIDTSDGDEDDTPVGITRRQQLIALF